MRLDFEGKSHIYGHHLTVPLFPLVPDYAKSVALPSDKGGKSGKKKYDDENLIIHGDNLAALKALLPKYAGKVDVVYIDPPYNTGNEGWIYNDNVNSPLMQRWIEENGPVDGDDLQRHDKWLCMMWPRLHLLKELLADTGVIFISIDDNEMHHLKMLMDEIFGEDNFIANLVWRKIAGGRQDSEYFAIEHDYILAYRKSDSFALNEKEIPIDESKFNDTINGRKCNLIPLEKWGSNQYKTDRPKAHYPIEDPGGNEFYPMATDGRDGCWRSSPENFDKDHIHWRKITSKRVNKKRIDRWQPCEVQYLDEQPPYRTVKSRSILYDAGTTTDATKDLQEVFGEKIFDTPKPVCLLKQLVGLGAGKDALVLDSFAGSGTTAHAVLALNAEDGGTRKFILVECEDYAHKITAGRIRKVIKGIPKSKDEQLKNGYGGSFTFNTLGNPMEIPSLLAGKSLPSYKDMAAFVFYTATGKAITASEVGEPENHLFFKSDERDFYLFYEPSVKYLKSKDSALTEEIAKQISKKKRKAVIFAPHKYISQKELTDMSITFCQLPYLEERIG